MVPSDAESALDNPIWASLTGRHASLAQRPADLPLRAARYPAAFSPLGAVATPASEDFAALRDLCAISDDLSVFGSSLPDPPPNWEVQQRLDVVQMIRRDAAPLPTRGDEIAPLGATDVDDMLALVELTHPGPFRRRTVELGAFVGVRLHGQLLAMAGERMWIGRYREVSGVCTHPDAWGRGLARALMGAVVNRMLRAGQTPFLHVAGGNERAIAMYESLGFARRAAFALIHARRLR